MMRSPKAPKLLLLCLWCALSSCGSQSSDQPQTNKNALGGNGGELPVGAGTTNPQSAGGGAGTYAPIVAAAPGVASPVAIPLGGASSASTLPIPTLAGASGTQQPIAGFGGKSEKPASTVSGAAGNLSALPPQPNFVFILGEAMGWTITSTQQDSRIVDSKSSAFRTPNLDTIAARGMHFANFYAPSPRCMPTRASLLTGRSPAQLHMTFIPEGNKDGATAGAVVPPVTITDLPVATPTVATILGERGYVSAHFGKWHAGRTDPSAYGFVANDGPTTNVGPGDLTNPNPTEAYGMTERAIRFITDQVQAGKPFYLQVSHYNARSQTDASANSLAEESARLSGLDADTIGHAAAIKDVDNTVGQLLDALEQLGITENTYVFFSSDHGSQGSNANLPLTQGKGTVWEGGIRVPLLVCGPRIAPGSESFVRATGVDLLPTLAQLAGVSLLPAGLEGGSLVDVWMNGGQGTVVRPRSEFVVHYPHYDKDPIGPASAILSGDWKLIHAYEDGSLRLFNLATDYAEKQDLANTLRNQAQLLDQQMTEYLTTIHAQMPGHQ